MWENFISIRDLGVELLLLLCSVLFSGLRCLEAGEVTRPRLPLQR
jgi:hypothetical protein